MQRGETRLARRHLQKHPLRPYRGNKTTTVRAFKSRSAVLFRKLLVDSRRASLSRSFKYLALLISSRGTLASKAVALLRHHAVCVVTRAPRASP